MPCLSSSARGCLSTALAFLLSVVFASAADLRVATLNVYQGLQAPGSTSHDAARDVLDRVDADVVALQEVRSSDLSGSPSSLDSFAASLGYSHIYVPPGSPLDSSNRNVFLSRFPILSGVDITSPPGANELTRFHPAVTVDVPNTTDDPLLIAVHLKCCLDSDDPFRRAIEMQRIVDHLAATGATSSDNVFILGDFNLIGSSQTYNSIPATGLPASYVLGGDIMFPVEYSPDPADAFAAIPIIKLVNFQVNGSTSTFQGGSTLDHILVTPALSGRPHATEIYNSVHDSAGSGLPKAGSPLPSGRSAEASDHYAVFGDFDLVSVPPLTIASSLPSLREDDPAGSASLTVSLPAAPGPGEMVTVSLSSNDPGEAVPALSSVLFTQGVSSIPVAIVPQTDGFIDGDQAVTFTATAAGYSDDFTVVTVEDVDDLPYEFTSSQSTVAENFDGFEGGGAHPLWPVSGPSNWLGVDDGNNAAPGNYAYGSGFENAVGTLPNGTSFAATADITNNTGAPITALQIAYDAEQWRASNGGNADTWSAELIIGGNPVPLPALDFTASTSLPTGGVVNGSPSNLSTNVTGLSVPDGASFQLRFTVTPGSGGAAAPPDDIFLNEIHYDNASGDTGEFVEVVVGPGFGDPLSSVSVVLYNGSNSQTYQTHTLDTFILGSTTASGHRIYYKDISGIQNGSPGGDGVAIVSGGSVLHFHSYEGTILAANGPANGMTSVDVGVKQDSPVPPAGAESLGLGGSGGSAADFGWLRFTGPYTKGTPNDGQTFEAPAASQGIAIDNIQLSILPDNDLDGIPDTIDPDDDNDLLADTDEALLGTDPFLADTDMDGTPDGQEDADSDGSANFAELVVFETDPLNGNSFFRPVLARDPANPGDFLISFDSLTGRNYTILRSLDLVNWTPLSVTPGTGSPLAIPAARAPGNARSFYKIEAEK